MKIDLGQLSNEEEDHNELRKHLFWIQTLLSHIDGLFAHTCQLETPK